MKKILVVEDDHDQAMALGIRLRKAGYEVKVAEDAVQGFSQSRTFKPDLILLDLGLPGGGGFFLLENARHIMDAALIPVIVLTARDPAVYRDRALQLGAAVYFQKPVDNAELMAAIARLLESVLDQPADGIRASRLKREQVRQWREILKRTPNDPVTLNDLAWVLATARDPELRNVEEALRLAGRLREIIAPPGTPPGSYRNDAPDLVMALLDTMAAIFAAANEFSVAVELVRDAIALATRLQQENARNEMWTRLEMYQKRQAIALDYP
jgi:DNA-binding response OmpR family regulator